MEEAIQASMNEVSGTIGKISKTTVLVISGLFSLIGMICLALIPKAMGNELSNVITKNPTIIQIQADGMEVKTDIENMKSDVNRTMKIQIDDVISSGQAAVKNLELITSEEKLIQKLATSQNGNAMKRALRTPEARPIIFAMNHDLAVYCDEYFGPQATWDGN